MYKLSETIVAVLLIVFVGLTPENALSQEQDKSAADQPEKNTQTETVGELSLKELKDKRPLVENAGDLGETVKKNVLQYIDKAIRMREKENQLAKEADGIAQMVKNAPERIKAIEAELDRPPPEEKSVESQASKMEPQELEQQIRKVEADFASAKTNLDKWNNLLKGQQDRPAQLQQSIAIAKQRLVKIENELKSKSPPNATPLENETRRAALLAEQDKNQAEIKSYEGQLVNHDALIALINAERDLANRELIRQEAVTKIWRSNIQRLRQLEAKKERIEAEQAKNLAVDMPPVMQEQLQININLSISVRVNLYKIV